MPRVQVRTYDASDFDHGQGLARGVAAFGQALGEGISARRKERRADAEAAREAAIQERKFKIEEAEAAAKLAKEENEAAARAEVQAQKQADRDQASRDYQQATAKSSEDALLQDVGAALRRSGGVLGPFGILNPRSMLAGLQRQAEIGKRMQANQAQASTMTPAGAKNFLLKEAQALKDDVHAAGYQEEFDLLSALQMEEKIDPKDAEVLNKELQAGARSKKPPGEIHKRLLDASELYVQAQARAENWEKADTQAPAMIDGLRKLIAEMPDGVDSITGKSTKAEMLKRLAAAEFEWGRTKPGANGVSVFRQKNDPADSLAGLQKILFEARIEADPEAAMRQNAVDAVPTPSREEVIGAIGGMGGGHRTQGGAVEGYALERAGKNVREESAATGRKAGAQRSAVAPKKRQQVANIVLEGAQDALRAGSPAKRKAAIRELYSVVADQLGVDAASPEVESLINEVLSAASAQPTR